MSESIWHRESCNPGREYQLARNIHIKYDDQDTIISRIVEALKQYVSVEAAVRLVIDTELCSPERAVIAVPFEANEDLIMANFAATMYHSLMGYYVSGEPKSSHFGLSNLVIEGQVNSLVRRELEKLFTQFQSRDDIAGRLLRNVKFDIEDAPASGDNYMQETLKKGLDIELGFRLVAYGPQINAGTIFVPVTDGAGIVDRVYYNLEQIIHQNFVAYDESGDDYLKVTDTLIFKELSQILSRAKSKENTRKKILDNLVFSTIFTEDPTQLHGALIGDSLYDTINKIQEEKLQEASQRSRELFASCMIRSAEMTTQDMDLAELQLSEGTKYVPNRPSKSEVRVPEREAVREEQKVAEPVGAPAEKSGIADRLSIQRDTFQEL